MGITLTHENHISNFGLGINITGFYNHIAAYAQIIPYLKKLKHLVIQSIFDCTTAFFGRQINLRSSFSEATEIQMATSTGYFGTTNNWHIPKNTYEETIEEIIQHWTNEFEHNIDSTNIKPGSIKLAFEDGEPSEIDFKLFEGGVLTHKKTGLNMAVHKEDNKEALTI